jgi:fructose-specific component phosphotransferase system IIB-like protein
MEQVERAHIQTSEVEIIAARIEADLSHVVGTYWALTAISAANGKKIPIASP